MRGIYIHIPFCRQACRYCDFFFSVSLQYVDEFVERLVKEISTRDRDHRGDLLDTIYLGGGTPSLLSHGNLEKIMESVHRYFPFHKDAEVTMECNPDDLNPSLLNFLITQGFNRLSIGVQSFHEKDLQLMRRSHHSEQAQQCVQMAADAGFKNITIDLIYGIPGQSLEEWEENIAKAILLPITHLSAYHLTYEPGTVFEHWRKKGRLVPVHEEQSLQQYRVIREMLMLNEFDHYEISNFARHDKPSKHNMMYWSGLPYLGVGPSAHSFDGTKRSWNIASLKEYMEGVNRETDIRESENLSNRERYHDYLITSLRTKWGADPELILRVFGNEMSEHFLSNSKPFLEEGVMWIREGNVSIHPEHWLITDHILKRLFMD